MSQIVNVTIVRPKGSVPESVGIIFGSVLSLALRAWIVMVLAPVVYKPVSYWFAVAACLTVSSLKGGVDSGYRFWTKAAR